MPPATDKVIEPLQEPLQLGLVVENGADMLSTFTLTVALLLQVEEVPITV